MKLETQADQWVICYAVDRVVGSRTMSTLVMRDWLIEHWPQLTDGTRSYIIRTVNQAIEGGYAGDPKIDTPMWKGLLVQLEGMTDGTK